MDVVSVLLSRILERITIDAKGCWAYPVHKGANGYGQIGLEGRYYRVHRIVYQALVGDIPDGLDLDHLCRTPSCCNPDHLEPVTRRVNTLRGVGPAAVNAAKDTCRNGHPFTEANTYLARNRYGVSRCCRHCNQDAVRRYKERKKALT